MAKQFRMLCRKDVRIAVALIVTVCLMGCGSRVKPLPTTYPVHGRVVYKDGSPTSGGIVQFRPVTESSVSTTAEIGEDGTYSLVTTRDGLRAEGAVAGANHVSVVVVLPGKHGGSSSANYRTPYTVAPKENSIDLTVEGP